MGYIFNYINEKNNLKQNILSVYLTSGFPNKKYFPQLAIDIFNYGADIIELGIPFSDPIADGPIIQQSSNLSLKSRINIAKTLNYTEQIKKNVNKPVVLMGYANTILNYGINNFANDAFNAGANGVIVPDVSYEEYYNFYTRSFDKLDVILLVSPTSNINRIKKIDALSKGFLYCVSMSATTGSFNKKINTKFLNTVSKTVKKNKVLLGFGISTPEAAKNNIKYCNGVIVGSAIIKSLSEDNIPFDKTLSLVSEFKKAISK